MLTTLTPYWGRPEALKAWLKAIRNASHPQVTHFVFFAGEGIPEDLHQAGVRFIHCEVSKGKPRPSIGYFHNIGAELASTKWIMKLDVDAIPNRLFFEKLVPILEGAKPREWFNAGMFYVNKSTSERELSNSAELLQEDAYLDIVRRIQTTAGDYYRSPAATNFICRSEDYMRLGGCDGRFRGWGWEDYQQIYSLEEYQQGHDPLPGAINLDNVSLRCRDEISRPKATALHKMDPHLALLHRWHPPTLDPLYRDPRIVAQNRNVLLSFITGRRSSRPHQSDLP